jgi:AAA domain
MKLTRAEKNDPELLALLGLRADGTGIETEPADDTAEAEPADDAAEAEPAGDTAEAEPADDVAVDEAFQKRLSHRLQNTKFIAWLEHEGYDLDAVTPQIVDQFDEFEEESLVDPAKMEMAEWNAGAEQWMHEGHDDCGGIPLERPKWEELLRRRAARLKAERDARLKAEEAQRAKAQLENRRKLVIKSLKPPKQSDIALNGKSICDAQNACQKGREELSEAWNFKYQELPGDVARAWDVYHHTEEMSLRDRTPTANDFPADPTTIKNGLADPEYQKFQRYSAAILQQLEQLEANLEHALNPPAGSRPPLKGWSLDEIDENDGSVWPVPGVIPHGLTFVYGLPKGGKSLWMQKLSACIAGGVPFDGIEGLEHGRVLYITRDIGASRQEVKKRLIKILPRLDLSEDALDGKLILTDDPFYLNDPASVDNLLAHNPGRFVLVVIDSLFRCVIGSLSQDVVASAAVEAIDRVSRATGAAMVAIHHEPRGGEHLFGSVMLDAAYDAQIHVERGSKRASVIVTVQELKNAPIPDKPFAYRIEEEYLAPVAGAGATPATTPKLASSRHQEMLALLPAGSFTRKEWRKLVEPLLTGSKEARRKQWGRAIAEMKATGQIVVTKHSVRKT